MTTANALVQTRIAANVRDRAVEVLDGLGLTVSDVVRIVLTRVANEGALPVGLVADTDAHDGTILGCSERQKGFAQSL